MAYLFAAEQYKASQRQQQQERERRRSLSRSPPSARSEGAAAAEMAGASAEETRQWFILQFEALCARSPTAGAAAMSRSARLDAVMRRLRSLGHDPRLQLDALDLFASLVDRHPRVLAGAPDLLALVLRFVEALEAEPLEAGGPLPARTGSPAPPAMAPSPELRAAVQCRSRRRHTAAWPE